MQKLLSIIIPVYNKEKYIEECLYSISKLNIDKDTIEVIVVDDCSTDNSAEIISNFSSQYKYIKSIKLETNSGSPSKPRNVAIEKATGKYLTLLDADDWLDSTGFPELLYQASDNNADIAFGQSIKHTNDKITKLGRFTSYTFANNLIPFEIERVFRSVGPPAKIFKKSIVINNNIKFEHMKYGEDKLFFIEVIAKCKTASMNNKPVYHVNRYEDNKSLVGQTTAFEKAKYNIQVLKSVIKLNLPTNILKPVISRIVEVDFLSRLFNRKRYLSSQSKEVYHQLFEELMEVVNKTDLKVSELIMNEKLLVIYELLIQKRYKDLHDYIEFMIVPSLTKRYIENDRINYDLPSILKDFEPLLEPCHTVYYGSRMFNEKVYETIKVYKGADVRINKVILSATDDESYEKSLNFQVVDNCILLNPSEISLEGKSFNIRVIYNNYHQSVVSMVYPSSNYTNYLERQNHKIIFSKPKTDFEPKIQKYFHSAPKAILTLTTVNKYSDTNFNRLFKKGIHSGELIDIIGIDYSTKGTPRLLTKDNKYITANKNFVAEVTSEDLNQKLVNYISTTPNKVKIIKKCKLYKTKEFKEDFIKKVNKNEEIEISSIEYTKNLTPRLVTNEGHYLTANKKFVKVIE
ncbi:DUF5776 domain-containing protein [Oceanobacillus sp. 1P07AA]|uniref:DUF5776 domain-containing protein n=1 Tax=Oceanobacillus sp. 1P07AA TaxID=3132293 RepID=UPI0039A75AC8